MFWAIVCFFGSMEPQTTCPESDQVGTPQSHQKEQPLQTEANEPLENQTTEPVQEPKGPASKKYLQTSM